MPFELLHLTEATLTTFTGRTETHGKATVPAVSFRLRFSGPNTLLDLLSPTARKTFYMAAEGQEDLPGVDPTTPHLRSRDIKQWSPENSYEGWTVTIDYGVNDDTNIEMGGCKIDGFTCELHDDPGMVDVECRIGTSNVEAAGAGWLWSKQRQKVHVMLAAPLTPSTNPAAGEQDERQLTLDGSTGAEVSERSAAREAADAAFEDEPDATDTFLSQHGENAPDEDDDGDEAPVANPWRGAPTAPKKTVVAKYRDPASGQTWSGRGLKPKWLTAALEGGKALADFEASGARA